ncbi:MAG: antitoxin [Actinomycetota bacterium]
MRTTLSLDDDVLAAARELARLSDRTLGDVVSELAAEGLAARRSSPTRAGRVPTFSVSGDDPVVTSEQVAHALDES